jgi:hypothetical protein
MSGFPALLAHRLMGLGGKNRLIRFPEITVAVTITIGLRKALPEAATRLFTVVANDKGHDLARAPAQRGPQPAFLLALAYKRPGFIQFKDIIWSGL